ncbi:MAG: HlyD family secretion protein [Bdellovibrionales bacterium]|nr:HlyD family secretion protein [Bdellovibrionales bacterium]
MSSLGPISNGSEKLNAAAKRERPWWQTRRAHMTGLTTTAVLAVGLVTWWFAFRPYVSTDDARVAATLVRVAPEVVGGRVIQINVKEGDQVKKGQVLAELDHRTTAAQLKRAQAKAELAARDYKRIGELVSQRGLAAKDLDLAKASAESADAELALAEVALEDTTIRSPVDGIVVQKSTEEGNIAERGQTLFTLVDIDHAWVAANIEETAVGDVRVGQPVHIQVDEGGQLTGKVSEVRASVASQFALIPSDNGAGNFTKVVQRVPIKVELDAHDGRALRAGQSVEIKIRVH